MVAATHPYPPWPKQGYHTKRVNAVGIWNRESRRLIRRCDGKGILCDGTLSWNDEEAYLCEDCARKLQLIW